MIVRTGHILALRLFDIAYAIDLAAAQTLLARHASGQAVRSRLVATPPKAMEFDVPPLNVTLELVVLDLDGVMLEASLTARLYDFGAVTLALRVPGPSSEDG